MAVFLTFIVPGLGQVYNGQAKKGVLFFSLVFISMPLACIVVLELPLAPLNIVVGTLLLLGMYLYSIVDAKILARRLVGTPPGKLSPWWYLAIIGIVMFIVFPVWGATIRNVVTQAFKLPSRSMEKTLLIGDHILISKYVYGIHNPYRGDVIVFRYPWAQERNFIMRVIALPGERVQLRQRQVYVNEQPLHEPYARYTANIRQDNFGPVVVPKKGDRIEIRSDNRLYLNGEPVSIPSNPHHPSGLFQPRNDGTPIPGFAVFYAPLFPPGTTFQQPVEPLSVAHDYYFTLGDNRDNSQDSRYWGFVPRANILGPAQRLYWSWDRDTARVRWERIGQSVR